ncbi:MAG: prepilin-type N-terminal cleavage/methylation domain-containing protein [Deltaproteobacteria bacterium]|jgi:prepilin-type N-terminal cleavage/methylation domain-containing protein|nr:prepilin-type N-terminal cleavage/methylation domain-containing protein [Deltaproteobacteria bacterium]
MRRTCPSAPARRAGFTLVELSVVIALVLILTSVGFGASREQLPRWRTRQAAQTFAHLVQQCRSMAIAANVECSVFLVSPDPTLSDPANPGGEYWVGLGNLSNASTTWDYLPADRTEDGSDDDTSQGIVDLSDRAGNYYARNVGIVEWQALVGPGVGNANRIVISPRGYVMNPSGDFNSKGAIDVVFANKLARFEGRNEDWVVSITRGGVVRVDDPNQTRFGTSQYGTDISSGS